MDNETSRRLLKHWGESSITQQEAAEIMGLSQSSINHYLKGRQPLNTDIIIQFADVLGIPPSNIDPQICVPKHRRNNDAQKEK